MQRELQECERQQTRAFTANYCSTRTFFLENYESLMVYYKNLTLSTSVSV